MKNSDRFAITSEFFDNPKIRLLSSLENGDENIMILLRLMFIADSSDDGGNLTVANGVYYTPEMLGAVLSKPLEAIQSALDIFEKFGITECKNGVIRILDFIDNSDENEADIIREQTRKRVAKHRQKNRSVTQCNGECNADVTLHVTQEEKENEKEESSLKKKSTPTPPEKKK
ncbi:MAG: phage replisome organizer N-terminal domain-containing protein [Clostridia bacterium]|nr:phage replisome organizer N-terminal domain-containing protein [Clostridia bacterium]